MSRRRAIDPWESGLPRSAVPRRAPGLRREEVAVLAGVSVDYYTRLEQGRVGHVSDQVLEVKSLVVVYPFRDLSIRGQAVSSGGMGSAPSRRVWSSLTGV
ncbi:helix-turn-helix domain-containing protein [Acidipropionibacterium acidipropionici]|nr:helix-turn-helix transcriptional regulator [Acidipropionibacterium acidipropionici]